MVNKQIRDTVLLAIKGAKSIVLTYTKELMEEHDYARVPMQKSHVRSDPGSLYGILHLKSQLANVQTCRCGFKSWSSDPIRISSDHRAPYSIACELWPVGVHTHIFTVCFLEIRAINRTDLATRSQLLIS